MHMYKGIITKLRKRKMLAVVSVLRFQIVDVDVVSQTPEGLDVMVQPSGFPAFVPLGHLSDHPGHWGHLLSVYGPTAGGGTSQPRRVTNVLFYGGSKKAASVSCNQCCVLFYHHSHSHNHNHNRTL